MIVTYIFYNYSNSLWRIFSLNTPYKHVDIIIQGHNETEILMFRGSEIKVRSLKYVNYFRFLEKLQSVKSINALITVHIKEKISVSSKVYSCNELARIITGIDVGFTLNPGTLLRKIMRYDYKRNYGILNAWRRS